MTSWKSRARVPFGLIGSLALLWLTGCFQITQPTILVESLRLEPGEVGILQISVFNLENLQVLQVGPMGTFTFDPEVIQIERITGLNGFQVFASAIDNEEGKALFLAGFPGGSLRSGAVLELEIRAVGSQGSSTSVELTQIDLIADEIGNEITRFELRGGRVMIRSLPASARESSAPSASLWELLLHRALHTQHE